MVSIAIGQTGSFTGPSCTSLHPLPTLIPSPSPSLTPSSGVPATPATALSAVIKAGGDYYPGQVDYGSSTIGVYETLKQTGKFNQLAKALEATGLDKALAQENGIFCLYAPTDEAFEKAGGVDKLLEDKAGLEEVLKYHVVKLFVKDKEHIRSFRLSNKVGRTGESNSERGKGGGVDRPRCV